jgi:large subunit ribosomal protein L15
MQIHQVKRRTENRDKRYVGRGGKRGKTSGRGTKGQNARAGRKIRPVIRDLIKKLPKNRGYKFKSIRKTVLVSKAKLKTLFKADEKVTLAEVRKRLGLSGAKIELE